jgi:hypothetical protein
MINKSIGNINNLPDFNCESATITNLTTTTITNPIAVSSTNTITDNSIVRGDGGSRGIQQSGVLIDDSDNITGTGDITMNTGTTLETNNIVSKTGSDITIDAVGDQRIQFGTLSNFGTSFTTSDSTNWCADFRNNVANYMAVAGTYNQSGDHRPQIGGHQISPLAWDVLWLNPVVVSTALVCVGNYNRSDVIAEASNFLVVGDSTSTVDTIAHNNLVLKKASSTSATLTGTFTGNHSYTIPDGGGTFQLSGGTITTSSVSNASDLTIQSTGGFTNILSNDDGGVIIKSSDDTDYSTKITNDTDTHGIGFRVYDDTANSEMRPIINGVTNTGTTITGGHSIWMNPYNTTDKVIIGNLKESDFGVGTMKLGVDGHILCDGIYTNGSPRIHSASRKFKLPTGTTDYTTAYDTSTITLQELAERVRDYNIF